MRRRVAQDMRIIVLQLTRSSKNYRLREAIEMEISVSKIRFKVLQKFPIWRREDDDVKVGMVFEVEFFKDRWPEVGGAYFLLDSPKHGDSVPDFSGFRLSYLFKHKFIEKA